MDAHPVTHPTDQALNSYGLGKLDDASAEAVNQHLEQCADCRKRVAEMSADSFLGRIRDARKPGGHSMSEPSQPGATKSYKGTNGPAPPPAHTLPPGLSDHPDYEIKRELGRGGMGVVYLAHNKWMGRDEVLKVMGRHIMERPGVLERFQREIKAVAKLRHPNIVTAYHATRIDENLVFAMEYVEGYDLAQLVKGRGPLPAALASNFVYQAALGLQHAHEEGLVHRDIKPGNLMLATLVAKMLAKEPGRRFQTPGEVAESLKPFFKKGSVAFKEPRMVMHPTDQSAVGEAASKLVSMPAQPATGAGIPAAQLQKATEPTVAEVRWESLIEFKDADNSIEAAPSVTATRRPRWLWPSVAVGVLITLFFAAWMGGATKIWTRNGIIEPRGDVLPVRIEPRAIERPGQIESSPQKHSHGNVSPPIVDRTQFSVLSGQWGLDGDELIQTDEKRLTSALMFGDERWTDYHFTVDAMRVGGSDSFSLFFRSTSASNEFEYVLAANGGDTHHVYTGDQGSTRVLQSYNFRLQNGAWYTVHVLVRGRHLLGSIIDSNSSTETRVFDVMDDSHPMGRVGLQTFGASVRFKNIKVTDPDGKVLWEGPPAVAPTTMSDVPRPPDQAKPPVVGQDGFRPLFSGLDLNGWKPHAQHPGNWRVENGVLVGGSGPLRSNLYTERNDYRDFHLRVEARIKGGSNLGVRFRASIGPNGPGTQMFADGYAAQIHGKPGNANFTASLFVGADAVVNADVPAVLSSDWISLEVIADGNRLVIMLNGRITAEYFDARRSFSSGHIALQQLDPQTFVEFRKIEIRELSPTALAAGASKTAKAADARAADRFEPLFNGRDLTGWHVDRGDPDVWHFDNGVLIANVPSDGRRGAFLLSEKDFSDFILRFEFQLPKSTDSGIALRAVPGEKHIELNLRNFDEPPAVHALTAALRWSTSGRGVDYSLPDRPAELGPDGAWNEMEIMLRGASLWVWVNRREVRRTDLRRLVGLPGALPALNRRSGRIGFQSHTGTVRFRSIVVQDLAAAQQATQRTQAKRLRGKAR